MAGYNINYPLVEGSVPALYVQDHKMRGVEQCLKCNKYINSGNIIIHRDTKEDLFIPYMALHWITEHKLPFYLGSESKGVMPGLYLRAILNG